MSILVYAPLLLKGSLITLGAWFVAGIVSLTAGACLGIMSCRALTTPSVSVFVSGYTFIAKGVPAYVQILIAYFVIPALLGIHIPGFIAATGALAFCSSGYVAEIVRSGIDALAPGQWDACFVLGYSIKAALWRVILPQTVKNSWPTLLGELEQLLKSTALLATIGITELTRTGMNIISRELNPIPVYLLIAGIYLLFSALLQVSIVCVRRRGAL